MKFDVKTSVLIGIILILSAVVFVQYRNLPSSGTPKEVPVAQLPSAEKSQIIELKNGDAYTLTASTVKKNLKGKEVRMLAYNGTIPGPTIKVAQGAEVTIHFVNNLDVPSTLHPHGIRLDNAFDGIPDVTQQPVQPGESFDYKIKFPDAGIYWYHPHIEEPYTQGLGLYGNFIVTPSETSYWPKANREVPLTLGDILIGTDATPAPFYQGITTHALMGRYGNMFLTQGEEYFTMKAQQGEVVRFYLTNVANARPFNFRITGTKMKLIGSDNGRYEHEAFVDSVILGPSERAVVDVLFDKAGVFELENKTPLRTGQLGSITVSNESASPSYQEEFTQLRENTQTISEFAALAPYLTSPVDKNILLTIDMTGMGMGSGMGMGGMHRMPDGTMMSNTGETLTMGDDSEKIEWEDSMQMMNSMSTANSIKWKIVDQDTKMENMDIHWNFTLGDKVKIRITNDAKSMHPMQHPIHFHGQRFVVLATNGVKNPNMVWKDTTLVQKGDTVDILLEATNPGNWMAHCHISEHLADNMMLHFSVK